MKRLLIFLILLIPFTTKTNAQEVSGSLSYMTTGVAPVPYFAIEGDAFFGTLSIDYGKIGLFADMALKGNGNLWFTDTWIRYNIIKNEKSNLRIAGNWSLSGQDYADGSNNTVRESTRYLMLEIYGQRTFRDISLSGMYWNAQGIGDRTIDGHFLIFSAEKPFDLGSMQLSVKPSVFFIEYTGNTDGLFLSGTASLSYEDIPLVLSFQIVPPVESNIENVETQSTFSLTYLF